VTRASGPGYCTFTLIAALGAPRFALSSAARARIVVAPVALGVHE
jgi:hypothetical protein